VANAVDTFVVNFAVNRFNSLRESYETAIKPFSRGLAENVERAPRAREPGLGGRSSEDRRGQHQTRAGDAES